MSYTWKLCNHCYINKNNLRNKAVLCLYQKRQISINRWLLKFPLLTCKSKTTRQEYRDLFFISSSLSSLSHFLILGRSLYLSRFLYKRAGLKSSNLIGGYKFKPTKQNALINVFLTEHLPIRLLIPKLHWTCISISAMLGFFQLLFI